VRTGSTKLPGTYHALVANSSADGDNGFLLAIASSNKAQFHVARRNSDGTIVRGVAISSATLAPGTTHHVVGTYNGSRVRIFVDGVERGSAPFSGAITWAAARDLRLGRAAATAIAIYRLDGVLDEVALYTAALPAATVTAHWNAGKP
jgi:hypothetical protein